MKTKLIRICLLTGLAAMTLATTACTSASFADKLNQFEALGVTEAQITGKFSNTEYRKVQQGENVVSILEHSNAWVPKVRIVRTRPVPAAK
jgi:hypothetical protein